MSTRVLLFVDSPADPSGTAPEYLLLPVGGEPAILRYASELASQCETTSLVVPQAVSRLLPATDRRGLSVHSYTERFGDGSLGDVQMTARTRQTVLIDATTLPSIDLAAMLREHRRGRAAMTVFRAGESDAYCRETLRADASGLVRSNVRQYGDLGGASCGLRPLAVVLSRRAFRPDRGVPIRGFEDLVLHLQRRFERVGEPVRSIRHAAVCGSPGPLEALLQLVERGRPQCTTASPTRRDFPGVRLHGTVEIGTAVEIQPGAVIVGPACLGDGCRIERGAMVSRSIVLPGATVRAGACVHNAVRGPDGVWFTGDATWGGQDEFSLARDDDAEPASPAPDGRCKRAFDVALAASGLLCLLPVLILVALAIRLSSRGPILSRHRRQGLGGAEFDCLKFRTAARNTGTSRSRRPATDHPDRPPLESHHVAGTTRLGSWLCRTHLDELPQLINVLRGEMSLVGPRPLADRHNRYCPAWRRMRLSVRPGITGLWQVARSPVLGLTGLQELIYYDTRYVEHRSLSLDLQILRQTVRMLLHAGAGTRWLREWRPRVSDRRIDPVAAARAAPPAVRPGLVVAV